FLYNTGNGVTIFKKALTKINDTTYLIGPDTLKISRGGGSSGGTGTDNANLGSHFRWLVPPRSK
ncbi:hypothetical protein, partial [Streptococcus pneumoniae]|uniref:hypothetical protein n=1 Tax=Streptococcus pneumoniae TaxID=1313 RepID=UPI0018B0C3BF